MYYSNATVYCYCLYKAIEISLENELLNEAKAEDRDQHFCLGLACRLSDSGFKQSVLIHASRIYSIQIACCADGTWLIISARVEKFLLGSKEGMELGSPSVEYRAKPQ